jgi:UDP-glucose 4-epimerase
MDFVFVEDVARANLGALLADAEDRVYNVGSGTETSLLELLQLLLRVMGREDLQPDFQPERSVNPVPRRIADTRAADRDLGFRTQVPLQEGLRRFVDWRNEQVDQKRRTD